MERGAVNWAGRARPRIGPDRVVGDKGYSSRKIGRYLRQRGIGVVIPRQKRERRTRSEKRAGHYLARLTIATVLLWH